MNTAHPAPARTGVITRCPCGSERTALLRTTETEAEGVGRDDTPCSVLSTDRCWSATAAINQGGR